VSHRAPVMTPWLLQSFRACGVDVLLRPAGALPLRRIYLGRGVLLLEQSRASDADRCAHELGHCIEAIVAGSGWDEEDWGLTPGGSRFPAETSDIDATHIHGLLVWHYEARAPGYMGSVTLDKARARALIAQAGLFFADGGLMRRRARL
jgi:hypothetical protein